ncbi:serine hydrolase-like protein [Centruroides sculpturatus]|uniref:serine hydrolase-like protein n=1 Tax=Centruroides sculpturatus TaxID=218467 RepID=UPI000C6E30FC|nr:serine hydrolase-like protein [Centruroides sculpturatus]
MQETKIQDRNLFKEIQIPINCGYLAAKEYGPPTGEKLLALHGWQDNAGSFDTLMPLLLPNLHVVVPDLAGHGLSSHKPSGCPYFFLEYINHIKLIADYLKWKEFSILGHSMGSGLAIMFGSIYPEIVNKIIGIELLKPLSYPSEIVTTILRNSMNQYVKLEHKLKSDPSVYSEENALRTLIGKNAELTEKSAKILMKRGVKQLDGGKVKFSHDIRIKSIWDSGLSTSELVKTVILNIKCDLLLIKAKDSPVYTDEESLNECIEIYKTKCNSFKLVEVEGNHFVHLNNPERIAPIINSFLLNTKSNI